MHRDTAIILLKNDAEDLSLTVMEEMRLLISICSSVVPMVPKTELVGTSSYHRRPTSQLFAGFELGLWHAP